MKERRKRLYLHKNYFGVIWGSSLKKAVEELEDNFRFIDNSVSDINLDARNSMNMQSITGFGMKDCLSLPTLAGKYFNSQQCEDDEDISIRIIKLVHSIKVMNQFFRIIFST